MLENFTETDISRNKKIKVCNCKYDNIITRGSTCMHTFSLSGVELDIGDKLKITYKQGLHILVVKHETDCYFVEKEDGKIYISVTLSPEESSLFKAIKSTPVEAQIEITFTDNKVINTEIMKLLVIDKLEDYNDIMDSVFADKIIVGSTCVNKLLYNKHIDNSSIINVLYKQAGNTVIKKENCIYSDHILGTEVVINLSAEETLLFNPDLACQAQLCIINGEDIIYSDIMQIKIIPTL